MKYWPIFRVRLGLEIMYYRGLISVGSLVWYLKIKNKGLELEFINKDPKDGELYLTRMKSGETLMEVRSDTNVQIVRLIWV